MDYSQLQAFEGWWDGVYHDAPQQAGGMEFNTNEQTVSDKFMVYLLELPEEPPMTGVPDIVDDFTHVRAGWFSIDGRWVGDTKPTTPGFYINGNRKIVIR